MGLFSKIISFFTGAKSKDKTSQAEGHAAVYLPGDKKENSKRPRKKDRPQSGATERHHGSTQQAAPKEKAPRREKRPQQPREKQGVHHGSQQAESFQEKRQFSAAELDMTGWVIPEGEKKNPNDVLFQELAIDPRILRALLDDMGFRACSPIQAQALPGVLAGEDIQGRAQTGTGKTATFLIGILQKYLTLKAAGTDDRANWQPLGVVLSPTRELALQIAKDAEAISKYCPEFRTVAVYGGMDYDRQLTELAHGVDLVVATPGRVIDYLRKHAVDFSAVKVMVIDEADRMLDMGFIPDVKRIFSYLGTPAMRQTMLFSATLTADIERLAQVWMRPNPKLIEIEPEHVIAEGVNETVYSATTEEKIPILLWTYAHEDCRRVIIFRNRKCDVETLTDLLNKCGIPCEMLSGDVEQKKRLRILEDFRNGKVKTIVATDVAGRGIHVDDVTHVVNYDLPYEAEDYVHRVGRTARAGHQGRAISFADEDGAFVIPEIEAFIERPLPITQPAEEMLILPENLKSVIAHRGKESHNGSYRRYESNRGYRGRGRR